MSSNPVREDDPLPSIENLQISGDATPGQTIQACGFAVNGTTSCKFSWLRGSEDNSMKAVEGADQPTYEVTARDVNFYLAIEVLPIDSRGRKGEVARILANDGKKINQG